MNKVLYITRNGLLEALGQSQVMPYLRGLSSYYKISLITFEKEKDVNDFEKSQKYKSGYTLYCKDCLVGLRDQTHQYKETLKSDENSKVCLVCQKEKPLNKFNKSKREKNKRESICSLCHRKSNREKTS